MSCGSCGGSYPGGVLARQGAQGIPGPPGPAGPIATATSGFAANTQNDTITVVLGGTDIPLPDGQNFSTDITPNLTNTEFMVTEAGRYYISFHVNPSASVLASAQLAINGTPISQSIVTPTVGVNKLSGEVIVSLNANESISLQLAGIAALVLLSSGVGASLTIIRVE
ncbi:collagen-like triple helix repeat-containing protein [Pontibacillus salicampi]|uniref:Collagen-like triple helix repeat-containing protein n=1 Tax=Pontibacillus salicampi TaxID=1449801 RepID=A0ABV6LR94_9BACI